MVVLALVTKLIAHAVGPVGLVVIVIAGRTGDPETDPLGEGPQPTGVLGELVTS